MECEIAQSSAVAVAAKESEKLREDGRRQFENCLERCRTAEAELKRIKSLSTLAAKDIHSDMLELQKQTLIMSLQYEKQSKALERVKVANDDAQMAIQAARAVQGRETSAVERELGRVKSQNARWAEEITIQKRKLTTEVRCRAEVSGQLKVVREELQATQGLLRSEEAKRLEAERRLKQFAQVLQKLRQARKVPNKRALETPGTPLEMSGMTTY
jgi:hypothetical protein